MKVERPEENKKFKALVNLAILKINLGAYLVRNCGSDEVVEIMKDIDSFYDHIKSNYPETAKKIFAIILRLTSTTEIVKILQKFSSQDSTGKAYTQIVSKYKESSGFFNDLREALGLTKESKGITKEPKLQESETTSESQEGNNGFEIQRLITSLHENLQIVLISLKNKCHAELIANVYNYKGLKSFTHQKPSVSSTSKETLKKKYYILTSKNNSYYFQQENKDDLEKKTKIAISNPPIHTPPNEAKSVSYESAPKLKNKKREMSDKDLGKTNAKQTGNRVLQVMEKLITKPSDNKNSSEEKLKKLKYFLMAIKLQGINEKKNDFSSLLKHAKIEEELAYNDAKKFSKLFQRASKKEGLLTGRVEDYRGNIKEDNIVGMRTKRIPLILVVELAKKVLNSDEFKGFMEFQGKIFNIPAKAPSAESSAALSAGQQLGNISLSLS